jgi:hypothetical protein
LPPQKKVDDAVFNYKLVKYGNSIHNIAFANKLLDRANQFAEESLKEVNSTRKLPYYEPETHMVPGECSNCHAGVEHLEATIFGWKYSHRNHLKKQGLSCNRCHSHEHAHGRLIIGKQDCMNCHHKEMTEARVPECKTCHGTQRAVYFSRIAFSTLKIPNVMADAIGCIDCHQDEKKKLLRRPDKTICSNCHEKEYEDMFAEWENNSVTLLNRLRKKVKESKLRAGDIPYEILKLLENDGSKGIHNPELYEKLLEEALK